MIVAYLFLGTLYMLVLTVSVLFVQSKIGQVTTLFNTPRSCFWISLAGIALWPIGLSISLWMLFSGAKK